MWDPRVVVQHLWGTFGLAIFPKVRFQKKKHYFYKSQPKFIKLFLNYLINGPHKKKSFGFLKTLKVEILTTFSLVFVNMGPYASEQYKTLLLQIADKSFQTSPEFSSHRCSQNYVRIFFLFFIFFFF